MPPKKIVELKAGRPTKYNAHWATKMAGLMAGHGMSDPEMAKEMGIAESTLYKWRHDFPEFATALDEGKDDINRLVEASIVKSALGYTFDEITQYRDKDGGVTSTTLVRRNVAGNVHAQEFLLKTRMRDKYPPDRLEVAVDIEGSPAMALAKAMDRYGIEAPDDG